MPKPTAEGEPMALPTPQGPPTNLADINKAIAEGQKRAEKAQARFQKFFYVVSDKSFKKMRPSRDAFYEAPKADGAPTPSKG